MRNQFYIIVFLFSQFCWSQNKTEANPIDEKKCAVRVIGRVQKDRILLRWGVTQAIGWKKSNQHGYRVERYTVTRDDKVLPQPEKKVLFEKILPDPVNAWETIIVKEKNENAGIMAQALYGKSFVVKGANAFEAIVNQSQEAEQRFTFALFAADLDFGVAKKAGLGLEDTDVKANEKYLYRVISNVPKTELDIEYGGAVLTLSEYEELPAPLDLTANFEDAVATLSWDFKSLVHFYGSYYVERSVDAIHFDRITKKPYTTMNQADGGATIVYVDSIANSKNYSYRVQGINAFGEIGPYSKVVSGEGKSTLKATPHLTTKNIINDNTVILSWEFDAEFEKDIVGFELNRADDEIKKEYTTVVKNIPPKSRSIEYKELRVNNYFTISAVGINGDKKTSFPMLVQPADSIPPSKPVGLKGSINKEGEVTLTWTPNKENDLMGYHILKANNPKDEYTPVTPTPIGEEKFSEKIVLKTLTSKVYYKIVALDKRYNTSDFSDALELKKPDILPPAPPVFNNYKVEGEQVLLSWANSSSDDVAAHYLYRKENEQKEWMLLTEIKDKKESYLDKKVKEGNQYQYLILAKDETGLESKPSPLVTVNLPKTKILPEVSGFFAQLNPEKTAVVLSWKNKNPEVAYFEIYKAPEGQPLQMLQSVPEKMKNITDNKVVINTRYQYAIRAVLKDGRMSKMNFINFSF